MGFIIESPVQGWSSRLCRATAGTPLDKHRIRRSRVGIMKSSQNRGNGKTLCTTGKRGSTSHTLTARQELFVLEYLKDLNGTQAAIRAGYSPRTAQEQSSRLLSNVMVAAEIQKAKTKILTELEITDKRVLEGLAKRAFYDVRNFFDKDKSHKEIPDLDDVSAAAVAGYEFITLYEGSGDQKHAFGMLRKVKLADAGQNLERLGRYLGLFKDRVVIEDDEFKNRTPEELRYYASHNCQWPDRPGGDNSTPQGGEGPKAGE